MALPNVAYDPTKTIIPRKSYIVWTPVVGGVDGTPVELIGKVANYESDFVKVERKIPDTNGLLRPDRIVATEHNEAIMFEIEDINLLADIFGGVNGGFKTGKFQLWVVDPDDAPTKVALKSNQVNGTAELDGGINFSAGELSKATIKFTALQTLVLSPDATA